MITRENLAELTFFDPGQYLTTTLYLHLEDAPQASHTIALKDLIRQRKQDLDALKLAPDVSRSVQADLKKIQDFVNLKFSREGVRTLILFSCSGKNWWKQFTLGSSVLRAFGSQLVIQEKPYLKPFNMALEEFHRFLLISIGRPKAALYEVYAGEIQQRVLITDEVPKKVRVGGYGGYDERHIERHIEDHLRRHFRNVADKAYEIFKASGAAHVILAGTEQNVTEFQSFLHSSMQEKLAGTIPEELNDNIRTLLERSLKIEQQVRENGDRKMLNRLFDQVSSGGLAVLGLDPTLRALQFGQVNVLIAQKGFAPSGSRCQECASLQIDSGNCQYCGGKLQPVSDIVDLAAQDVLNQGGSFKFISAPDSPLAKSGHIGALLRFRL